MSVKLLTEHHLEFLRLKGGCTGSSESRLVKMPHRWKSHVMAHFHNSNNCYLNHFSHLNLKVLCSCGLLKIKTGSLFFFYFVFFHLCIQWTPKSVSHPLFFFVLKMSAFNICYRYGSTLLTGFVHGSKQF